MVKRNNKTHSFNQPSFIIGSWMWKSSLCFRFVHVFFKPKIFTFLNYTLVEIVVYHYKWEPLYLQYQVSITVIYQMTLLWRFVSYASSHWLNLNSRPLCWMINDYINFRLMHFRNWILTRDILAVLSSIFVATVFQQLGDMSA